MWALFEIGFGEWLILTVLLAVWAVRDYRRHHPKPERLKPAASEDAAAAAEETPEVMRRWEETCRSVDALKERRTECERRARARSKREGTDFEAALTEELKREFA